MAAEMETIEEQETQDPQANEGGETQAEGLQRSDFGLFFELEHVAVPDRAVIFEMLKKKLGEHDAELTVALFCRCCIDVDPAAAIPVLLEELELGRLSEDKFIEEFQSQVSDYYMSRAELDADVSKLLEATQAVGIPCVAISSLEEGFAEGLMERLGLKDRNIELFSFADDDAEDIFPRADTWIKVAKSLSKSPRHCAACVSSAASCKAVLSAGMNCVAIPDEYTSFEDFGGAEIVVDDWNDVDVEGMLPRLFPILEEE